MRQYMRKPCSLPMKRFGSQLIELVNCLSLFPGLDKSKNIKEEYMNEIILHVITNGRGNQVHIQGCYSKMNYY